MSDTGDDRLSAPAEAKADVELAADEARGEKSDSMDEELDGEDLDEEDKELVREYQERIQKTHDSTRQPPAPARQAPKRVIEDSDSEPDAATFREGHASDRKKARTLEEELFSDADTGAAEIKVAASRIESGSSAAETQSSSDLEDFIEEPDAMEDGEDAEDGAEEAKRPKSERASSAKERSAHMVFGGRLGRAAGRISKEAWSDLMEVFGDGTDYADMVWGETAESDSGSESNADVVAGEMKDVSLGTAPYRLRQSDTLQEHPKFYPEEAEWIQRELARSDTAGGISDSLPIERVLRCIRTDGLEVPFIAAFRKDIYLGQPDGLSVNQLWQIHDLDGRFIALKKAQIAAGCKTLDNAELVLEWRRKHQHDRSALDIVGLGLSPSQFASNCKAWAPLNMAKPYSGKPLDDIAIDKGLALAQLKDALVQRELERVLLESDAVDYVMRRIEHGMCLSAEPTALGLKTVGMRHELAPQLSLSNKPLAAFTEDSYLILDRGEKAGLVTLGFGLPGTAEDDLLLQLEQLYPASGQQDTAQGQTLLQATRSFVSALFLLAKEHAIRRARHRLLAAGHQWIAQCCQYELQERLMQAPGLPPDDHSTVAVVSWGSGEAAAGQILTQAAILADDGKLQSFERFLLPATMADPRQHQHQNRGQPADAEETERLIQYLRDETGCARVLVSGTSPSTVLLFFSLQEALGQAKVAFALDDIARVQPRAISQEFSSSSALLKYAVSVGRRWLDPLAAYAGLESQQLLPAADLSAKEDELLRLDLHAKQSQVPLDMRLKYLTRALVNVVNLVGVSLPEPTAGVADSEPYSSFPKWKLGLFKYVCGLGPLAARTLEQISLARARRDLGDILQPQQQSNAAGFIRLEPSGPGASLESLRIHPEDYRFAERILKDAFPGSQSASIGDLLARAKENPEALDQLAIDDYAQTLKRELGEDLKIRLRDIVGELKQCHADPRPPAQDLDAESVFWMISGEREAVAQPGSVIRIRLLGRLQGTSAFGRTEASGCPVRCMLDHLADSRYRPGQVVEAIVLAVNPDPSALLPGAAETPFRVSIHPDDTRDPKQPYPCFDPYYVKPRALDAAGSEARPGAKVGGTGGQRAREEHQIPPSIVHHPVFKEQMTRADAEVYLKKRVAGEAVVRKSSSSQAELVISWRVCSAEPDLIQHCPLSARVVKDKLMLEVQGLGSGGATAGSGRVSYEDLDELVARGIEPMAALLDAVASCPKYLKVPAAKDDKQAQAEAEALLGEQGTRAPGRIAYGFWLSRDFPGLVILSIASAGKVHHEPVAVTPDGYVFRRRHRFATVSSLVDYLKRQ